MSIFETEVRTLKHFRLEKANCCLSKQKLVLDEAHKCPRPPT